VAHGRLAARQLQERHQLVRISRDLGITQKSAWFMAHRLRFALHHGSFDKLTGEVEADETYVAGKAPQHVEDAPGEAGHQPEEVDGGQGRR
jgi:hypothetical protein